LVGVALADGVMAGLAIGVCFGEKIGGILRLAGDLVGLVGEKIGCDGRLLGDVTGLAIGGKVGKSGVLVGGDLTGIFVTGDFIGNVVGGI
jgi:hypothetical protein